MRLTHPNGVLNLRQELLVLRDLVLRVRLLPAHTLRKIVLHLPMRLAPVLADDLYLD